MGIPLLQSVHVHCGVTELVTVTCLEHIDLIQWPNASPFVAAC